MRTTSVPPAMLSTMLLALLFAGCVGDAEVPDQIPVPGADTPPATVPATHDTPPLTTGLARVMAVTPDLSPIQGATAAAGDVRNSTDAAGMTNLTLPTGNHSVVVSKDGWRSARLSFSITPGQTVDLQAKLFPGDQVDDMEADNAPYQVEYDFTGVFECSLTYLIITGDCLLIADFVLNETLGLPIKPGDATEEQNAFEFPLDAGWESVVVEMVWEAPLAPVGEKMQLALEPSEYNETGHAPKYARVTGTSPLNFAVHKGVAHPTASTSADGDEPDMPNPHGGEVVMARAYVLGELHNPGGTDFLGVGAAYGQKFDIYVTVFYNEAAPDGFSRIP